MVHEIIAKYAIQETIKATGRFLKEKGLAFDSTEKDIESALATLTHQVNSWSKDISFNDLKKSKKISDVFIELDIFLMPRKQKIEEEDIEQINCRNLFSEVEKHCVILGQPGAGKTTLMKFICQSVMLDEQFYRNEFQIPIIIRLRELNNLTGETSVIINFLFESLGLRIKKDKMETIVKDDDFILARQRVLLPVLENIKPLIILDGFDELSTQKLKDKVLEEFKFLSLTLRDGRVILTSRSSDYNYSIENTSVLEICPLSNEQVKDFAKKWLGFEEKTKDFLKNLRASPFADTTIRPLTLSHLCAIYERAGKIPDKPKTVYKKIVNLLLEEWDEQREVRRISQYGDFEIDRKFEFLCRMAFEITARYQRTVFSEEQLKRIYHEIAADFSLPKNEASKVIKEIEGHTGLIIQSGYSNFEFAHKSIHEYLCAEHLVKLPVIPKDDRMLLLLPNELAIATTISSNPSLYFCELVMTRFISRLNNLRTNKFDSGFITNFVNRLVIEKPDFNLSADVSLSLVVLYTLFRRNEHGQLKLFNTDLPIQFERFVELVFKKNKKFEFTMHYELEQQLSSETNDPIIKLKRRTNSYGYRLEYYLPDYLFAKASFVAGF